MLDLSKLGPMDDNVAEALRYLDRLLATRRRIEAEARAEFTPGTVAVIQGLEAEQAAYFRELHRVMDYLEAKTR